MDGTTRERLRAFRDIAQTGGTWSPVNLTTGLCCALSRDAPDRNRETQERMCLDRRTNSMTAFWMAISGQLATKTFRGAAGLQEWFELKSDLPGRDEHTRCPNLRSIADSY